MYWHEHPHVPFCLTELEGGHSGAELYCAEAAGQKYLLKILPNRFDQERLERISEICELYEDLGVRSLGLVKFGKIKTTNQPYCFYNYIDGDNFEVAGAGRTAEENYRVGKQIGDWLETLKKATPSKKLSHHQEDVMGLTNMILTGYHQILTDPAVVHLALEYYDMAMLMRLSEELLAHTKIFQNYTPHLIHGDIKRSNVMLDREGKIWLIDIESMKISYDILNFRHQMTWFLSAKDQKKMEFLRGVFDGMYKNTRPVDFQQQLIYITILNFCEYATHHRREPNELRDYFARMQPVFSKLFAGKIKI